MRDKWLWLYGPHDYQPWYQYLDYHIKSEITLILDEYTYQLWNVHEEERLMLFYQTNNTIT